MKITQAGGSASCGPISVSVDAGGPTWFKVACSSQPKAHPSSHLFEYSWRIAPPRPFIILCPAYENMMDKFDILDLLSSQVNRHTWRRTHIPDVARIDWPSLWWSIIISPLTTSSPSSFETCCNTTSKSYLSCTINVIVADNDYNYELYLFLI